jgi:hypothetical protein
MARPTVKSTNSSAFTGGRRTVVYRDARGRTFDAIVTSAGAGANEVNLRIPTRGAGDRLLTDVAKATSEKQTNRWFWRTSQGLGA